MPTDADILADVIAEIRNVLIEDNESDWRELNSCADAIQDISLILSRRGLGPMREC